MGNLCDDQRSDPDLQPGSDRRVGSMPRAAARRGGCDADCLVSRRRAQRLVGYVEEEAVLSLPCSNAMQRKRWRELNRRSCPRRRRQERQMATSYLVGIYSASRLVSVTRDGAPYLKAAYFSGVRLLLCAHKGFVWPIQAMSRSPGRRRFCRRVCHPDRHMRLWLISLSPSLRGGGQWPISIRTSLHGRPLIFG